MAMMVVRCSGNVTSLIPGHFPIGYQTSGRSFGGLGDASKQCVERSGGESRMALKFAASDRISDGLRQSFAKQFMMLNLCNLRSFRKVKVCGLQTESGLGMKRTFHEGNSGYKLPAMTLLFTNVLMIIKPLEAHAETCEATDSVFNMPILLAVALIGATVGGLLARQRKGELQRVNEQLRQINTALRRQAKIESYAPSLSYAPVGKVVESEVIVDPKKQELISRLKAGKSFLRSQNPEKAFFEFKAALELAQSLNDPIEEKKAARGLGASLQRQGKYQEAIKYHSMVLDISKRESEHSGSTEAYGAIADCYTELGDLEQAGKYYDRYIERLESD